MFGLGAREMIILVAILVLLFGAKKIPELARAIGDALRHIRGGFSDGDVNKTNTPDKKDK